MFGYDPIVTLLIILGVGAVLFVVLREFFCWYTKTNELISLLTQQNKTLSEIKSVLENVIEDRSPRKPIVIAATNTSTSQNDELADLTDEEKETLKVYGKAVVLKAREIKRAQESK